MKKSLKKHLAISMLSVFAASFVGSNVKANNFEFYKKFLIAIGIAVPVVGIGVGVGACVLSNKDDDKDKKPDVFENQDETIKILKLIYSSFENIIKLSMNPDVNEFEQNIKNYLACGDNCSALKNILFAFYQVCGNTEKLSNEQFGICLQKLSQVRFELSNDKNALIITKNSTKFLLINDYNFVNHIRMNKKEINDIDFSRNRNEFDKLFVSWKNKKLSDGDFVDKVGTLVKNFEIKNLQNNPSCQYVNQFVNHFIPNK